MMPLISLVMTVLKVVIGLLVLATGWFIITRSVFCLTVREGAVIWDRLLRVVLIGCIFGAMTRVLGFNSLCTLRVLTGEYMTLLTLPARVSPVRWVVLLVMGDLMLTLSKVLRPTSARMATVMSPVWLLCVLLVFLW